MLIASSVKLDSSACSDRMKDNIPAPPPPRRAGTARFPDGQKHWPRHQPFGLKKEWDMFDKVVKSTVPGQVIEQIKELLVKGELKREDLLRPNALCGYARRRPPFPPRSPSCAGIRRYAGNPCGRRHLRGRRNSIMMNNLLMLHLIKQCATRRDDRDKVLETSNVRFAVLGHATRISPRSGNSRTVTRPDR